MLWIARTLATVVALEHFYILVLEMFLWRTARAQKVFGVTPAFAEQTGTLAANQIAGRTLCIDFSSPNIAKHMAFHHIRSTMIGNGFLGAGLLFSLAMSSPPFVLFFLGCVMVAGLYGGYTVKPSIYWVQALPAALATGATAWAWMN